MPGEQVFRIASDWPVLILEDTDERVRWFKERIPQAMVTKSTTQAIEWLEKRQFKAIFLDHDLGFLDADPTRQHRNGKEIARYLRIRNYPAMVVIHSHNPDGVAAMAALLPAAKVARYGTFEIEYYPRNAAPRDLR